MTSALSKSFAPGARAGGSSSSTRRTPSPPSSRAVATRQVHARPMQPTGKQLKTSNFLSEALHSSGLQNKLKSELRYQLIENLRGKGKDAGDGDILQPQASSRKNSLQEKALFSLILEALKCKGKLYSMSVLTPECGLRDGEIMSAADVCKVLGLDLAEVMKFSSSLLGVEGGSGRMEMGDHSLSPGDHDQHGSKPASKPSSVSLLQLLLHYVEEQQQQLQRQRSQKRDSMAQTDASGDGTNLHSANSLEFKLKKLEMSETGKNKHVTKYLEEKLLLYQQQCEKRYRSEMENELQRLRALERQQMRLEEGQKARAEYQTRQLEANKMLAEKEENLRLKEEKALARLQAKELEIERKAQDQRTQLFRKMEEQNLIVQRKTEWVALEEKKLSLVGDNLEVDRDKFAEERRVWELQRRKLEEHNQAEIDKHKLDVEKNLAEDMAKARQFQLSLEKEKCQLDMLKKEREQAVANERKMFEESTGLRKQIIELEDRLKEFKILHENANRQVQIANEQTKIEQQQIEKLRTINTLREDELRRQEEQYSGMTKKEGALLKQQEMNAKLLQKQIDDLRRDVLTKQEDLDRAVQGRQKSERESEEFKCEMLKLKEDNIKLKVEVERLLRRNEDGVLKERELRRVEQLLYAQYAQNQGGAGGLSPTANLRSADQSPNQIMNGTTLDPERLFAKWEEQIDTDLASTKPKRGGGSSVSGPTSHLFAGNAALERKTKLLNQEIADFARTGFFKSEAGANSLTQSVDVDAILKEAEYFDGKSYVEKSRRVWATGFGSSQSPRGERGGFFPEPGAFVSSSQAMIGPGGMMTNTARSSADQVNYGDVRTSFAARAGAAPQALVHPVPSSSVAKNREVHEVSGSPRNDTQASGSPRNFVLSSTGSAKLPTVLSPRAQQLTSRGDAAGVSSGATEPQDQSQSVAQEASVNELFATAESSRKADVASSQRPMKAQPAQEEEQSFRLDDFFQQTGNDAASSSSSKESEVVIRSSASKPEQNPQSIGMNAKANELPVEDEAEGDASEDDADPLAMIGTRPVTTASVPVVQVDLEYSTPAASPAFDDAVVEVEKEQKETNIGSKLDDVYQDLLDRRKAEQAQAAQQAGNANSPGIEEEIMEEIFSQAESASFKSDDLEF
mmetsp:Transcript_10680/g.26160  ORF Transcript_10680/g.26160 Transcript_10680/m.26160 type:complete len:1137 (+) Transcript_10680:241-3651(+)|eukprot:CAMPEP_0178991576 /NCGR_PEP_ID=MMETSP0795-20121207/5610_1 /TAXON_ID=88552 /ORGANISM="Amoebophrya sp., Strain Ameob2" /LENGTH=1136 /DNA_ID=CAMNT_0020683311 /DNA_START=125 /DNA_END=3535 /DNA_ORIENTATION=+